jgi:anti-sigma regulatory factor (Ser/Thr protein kinase)
LVSTDRLAPGINTNLRWAKMPRSRGFLQAGQESLGPLAGQRRAYAAVMRADELPSGTPSTFQHEVLHYRGDAQFSQLLGDFIRQGLDQDEAVAVAETPRRIGLLRDELGTDANAITFLDLPTVGGNPARTISFWYSFFHQQHALGRQIRGIGEPGWPGRRDAEMSEVRLHELLVNRLFDPGPGWRLLCPYDAERLTPADLEISLRTHPVELLPTGIRFTEAYRDAAILEAFADPLPSPPGWAYRQEYSITTLADLRRLVADYAGHHNVPSAAVDDLVLAGSEIASNSCLYGGGSGQLHLWTDEQALHAEFSDAGHITDPLVGRWEPRADSTGGRGVYIANRLCDLVQLRSSAAGTTVRLTTWLPLGAISQNDRTAASPGYQR